MNVIGYVISYKTDPEEKHEENLLQGQKIEAFCEKQDLRLREILVEPDNSRPDFRPSLVKLMNDAPKGKYRGVVICGLDKLAEEEDIRSWIIDEFNKYKIKIYDIGEESEKKAKSIKLKVRDLPSLPEVVTKITELVQDPNSSAADISMVIAQDSGLTSRVLRLVNSAYYGFPKQISSIQHAIMILGFTTIKGLVLSSSIFRMFAPKDGMNVTLDYKKFWKHSLLTAIASKRIYKQLFFEEDENIFSAAILHDIGKVILDQYDHNNYVKAMADKSKDILIAEKKHCQVTHPSIGGIVAESWNLPPLISDIIKYHHNPLECEENQRLAIVVYIGNIISQLVLDGVFTIHAFDEDVINHLGADESLLSVMYYDIREEAAELDDLESFFK